MSQLPQTSDRSAPGSRRVLGRRLGFAAVAFAFAVTMVGTTLPTPLYAIYRQEFDVSLLMITVIFATYAAGVIAALLLFGRLSDQVGRRRMLLAGLALSALSAAVFLLAQGVGLLLVGRVISGLSAGIFTGTATAALLDLAPPQGRARATLVATTVSIGGLGCGALLAGVLAEFADAPLRLAFWVDLALVAAAVALVWWMPEPVAAGDDVRLRPQRLDVPPEVRGVFVPAAIAAFAGFAVLGLFTAVAPGFLSEILDHRSHATAGLVVFVVFAASAVGQSALAPLAGDIALPAGCAGLLVGIGIIALSLAISSLALLVVGGVVAGLGQGVSFRAGLTAVNERTPSDRRAEVASSFFVVAYVAISVPVVGVGVAAQLAGLRTAGLIFAAVVSGLVLAVLGLLARSAAAGPPAPAAEASP